MAGQIAELARDTRRDFRNADTTTTRVLLVETADRVLTAFEWKLSTKAFKALQSLGVTPLVGHTVVDITADAVTIRDADGNDDVVPARTAIWAAGVTASSLGGKLGGEQDRAGRVTVTEQLTLPDRPEVFVLGDMVRVGGELPPRARAGGDAAGTLRRPRDRRPACGRTPPTRFKYKDKGNLATIGRLRAVGELGPLRLSGFLAWALWLSVHLAYLIGFQNRLVVLLRWSYSFFSHGRAARVMTR
jgi:NADH dehydrogenase, FAD-containing subunit